jgi:zinc transport system ATP-binding protein
VTPALELDGVSFRYAAGADVLHGVDLRIDEGEFVAVAGPNGGGKTTLVRLAVGLARPDRGAVRVFGEDVSRLRERWRIGYLPQRAQVTLDAPATVAEIVATGLAPRLGVLGPLGREGRRRVERAIGRVGLADRARAPLHTLSGGQQQRAFIAKALAAEPRLLVLDEPTVGVDAGAQEALADLLAHLREELGVTIVFVSHEFGAIEPHVDRLVLVRGGIAFDGAPGELPDRWHDPSHVHL